MKTESNKSYVIWLTKIKLNLCTRVAGFVIFNFQKNMCWIERSVLYYVELCASCTRENSTIPITYYKMGGTHAKNIVKIISLLFCFSPISFPVQLLLVFVSASGCHDTALHSRKQVLLPFQEAEAFFLDDIRASEDAPATNPDQCSILKLMEKRTTPTTPNKVRKPVKMVYRLSYEVNFTFKRRLNFQIFATNCASQ